MDPLQNIAIVGASAAGVAAAAAIRRHGFEGTLTIYDEDPRLPYERPPLSKSASGSGSEPKAILPPDAYGALDIELRLGQRVVALGSDHSLVLSDATTVRPDRVLLATGVSARRLTVPGAKLKNVMCLRTADDAKKLTVRLRAGGPLVVVGGGFIGLELAATARTMGLEVTVIEMESMPLVRAVSAEIAALFTALHTDRGVRIVTDISVAAFRGAEAVEEVVLSDGRVLPADTVVMGVGVTPNDQVVRSRGITRANGVIVDQYGATTDPWIWAAGDVAVRPHRHLRRRCRIEHWDTAQRHGEAVGRSLMGDLVEDVAVPYVWSDQYEFTYQAFGRREPGDEVVLRNGAEPHSFLAFYLEMGIVRAVSGIGHPREVRAGRSLVEAGTRVNPVVLRDPATDLRRLAVAGRDVDDTPVGLR